MRGYFINSSEKTQKSATEQETKTMLYLMGYMNDSKKVESFIIDAFNDVTGIDENKNVYWDSQSKGDSLSSPKAIGEELVTLYKNYVSIFDFDYYILSIRRISDLHIIEEKKPLQNITVLKFDDFTDTAKKIIKKSLIKECNDKSYIPVDDSLENNVDDFLKVVKIVINNEPNNEYVKKVTFMRNELIREEVITDIFETIRVEQLKIKTKTNINGVELKTREEAFNLNRTLSIKSINSLILGKILGHDIIAKNNVGLFMPVMFNDYVRKHSLDTSEIDGVINDATNGIYLMLINENLNKDFWALVHSILEECDKNDADVYQVWENINIDHPEMLYLHNASEAELVYLIACVLGGKKNEN